MALEIDQVVSGAPRTNGGNCTTDKVQSYDYCALLDMTGEPAESLLDGILPLGGDASQLFQRCKPGGDHFSVYLTTQVPADAPSNAFRPPTSPTDTRHGFHLGAPLVVTERTTGTFIVSAVANSHADGRCELGAGSFSFESGE